MVVGEADCFICRKHRGEVELPGGPLVRDDFFFVGHRALPPDGPVYLGYFFIETIRHVEGLADLTTQEAERLGPLMARLSRALKVSERAEHIYAFVIGDHMPHLHVHMVPRYPGAPPEYWGVRVDDWPAAPRGDAAAVEALCARLRHLLDTI